MSDDGQGGGGGGGYKIEYSPNARAACKGPAPCKGTKINKEELRFGSVVDIKGHKSMMYRHYGCITPKVWANIKKSYSGPEEIEGFDALKDEDKTKFRKAFEDGKVDPADVPQSASADADEEDAPKKKPGRPKKQPKGEGEDGDAEPKPKRAPRARKPAKKITDDEISASDDDFDDGGSNYGSGKKRKRGAAKRSPAKKRAKKDDIIDDDD